MSRGVIVLVRHGETVWSAAGRHTSTTDLALTETGESQAGQLRPVLAEWDFDEVRVSPWLRAARTAELAGLSPVIVDTDLTEWDYGDYEGLTTPQIRESRPGWDLWRDGCPKGESAAQVGARLDRLLDRVRPILTHGDAALVAHGHSLRVCAARWVGLPPEDGSLLKLDTATVSVLGFERERPVLLRWNTSTGVSESR
ncbi:MAG: histidine phosphatase family protein [Longispora sp.]|nr:histidine phosphatase family protein [Longispora sp. (in: high G+C Gram-positive bacteria)]